MTKQNFILVALILSIISVNNANSQDKQSIKSSQNLISSYQPSSPSTSNINTGSNSGIQGALQDIMLKQGKITKKEYDNFWQKVGITSPQEKEIAIASIKKNFILMQEYNREIWNCAEQAWYKSKVVPCPKADAIINKFKQDQRVKDQEQLISLIESSYQNIINSAASKQELIGKDGTKHGKINLETIQSSRKLIDEALKKYDKILVVEFVE